MTIRGLVDLYHTSTKGVESGNNVISTPLPLEEVLDNKEKAVKELNDKTKEELVDYILWRHANINNPIML